jgi:prevent-host-death family protein
MQISISEAHNHLSRLLDRIEDEPVTITRRGKPVGVIVSPQEYRCLSQVKAYLQMLCLSRSLSESGVNAAELFDTSRKELEKRP